MSRWGGPMLPWCFSFFAVFAVLVRWGLDGVSATGAAGGLRGAAKVGRRGGLSGAGWAPGRG